MTNATTKTTIPAEYDTLPIQFYLQGRDEVIETLAYLWIYRGRNYQISSDIWKNLVWRTFNKVPAYETGRFPTAEELRPWAEELEDKAIYRKLNDVVLSSKDDGGIDTDRANDEQGFNLAVRAYLDRITEELGYKHYLMRSEVAAMLEDAGFLDKHDRSEGYEKELNTYR